MRERHILYLTVDGVLEPLGYSQVCRVLLGLARRGFRYRLISLEKPASLLDTTRVAELRSELRDQGIDWTAVQYDHSGNARAAASNLGRLARRAFEDARDGSVGLVHARAYHAAGVALGLKQALGVPYLFDARGRWIDERVLGGRWFTNPAVERGARFVERRLYRGAAAFVTLTQLHANDIAAGDFGEYRGVPTRVITTCADFASFPLDLRFAPSADPVMPAAIAERLDGKLVLGFVGSTNAFYRHEESFALARSVLAKRADSHLLILSPQEAEFGAMVERFGIPSERVTVQSVPHRDMPGWLRRIDWAIQLLNGGVAKRGSMPTKLAEFFAAGVRPAHFGCNDEVSDWVARAGSGIVLRSLGAADLEEAAQFIATSPTDRALLERARSYTQAHFDLAAGLATYDALLRELGQRPQALT